MSTKTTTDPQPLMRGTGIGPWVVLELEGAGAFGRVYRCQRAGHPETGVFALKLALEDKDIRFEREAELLRQLSHRGIPRFEDLGLWTAPNGLKYPYLVMEWVEGSTLYEWMTACPRSSREVLALLSQLGAALASAHELGIVHRDVKGENIRVTRTGRTVLLDWGSGCCPTSKVRTDGGLPPGTPSYRPPDQFRPYGRGWQNGNWVSTPADDVYSLGVTFYRLVTGRYPEPGHISRSPQAPRPSVVVSLDTVLESLITQMLSESPGLRGSAGYLASAAQERALNGPRETDRHILRVMPELSPTSPSPRRRGSRLPWGLLSWSAAAAAGGLLVAVPSHVAHQQQMVPAAEPETFVDTREGKEGPLATGRKVPATPPPGTKTPPCKPVVEVRINGGCWVPHRMTPPCDPSMYEHGDMCLLPAADPGPKPPTSIDP